MLMSGCAAMYMLMTLMVLSWRLCDPHQTTRSSVLAWAATGMIAGNAIRSAMSKRIYFRISDPLLSYRKYVCGTDMAFVWAYPPRASARYLPITCIDYQPALVLSMKAM